ncbi:MAG: hypothetical protein AAFS11_06355 [Planctomycetota bacterium]
MARGKINPWMAGVLGVAVVALIADRWVTSANASDANGPPGASVEAAADTESGAPPKPRGPTLASKFDAFASADDLRNDPLTDAFGPLEAAETAETAADGTAEAPDRQLKLTAVLRRDDGDLAVINGRPMRVGETANDVEVVRIDADSVEVRTSVGPITLQLFRPSLQSRSTAP